MQPPDDGCGNAAAYALGALDERETQAFQAHLETCVVCRDELVAFEHVVSALPMSAPQLAAPRSLRRRVLRQVRSEARAAAPVRRRAPWLLGRPQLAGLIATGVAAIAVVVIASSGGSSGPTGVFPSTVGYARAVVSSGHAELVVEKLRPPSAGNIYEVWLEHSNDSLSRNSLFETNAAGGGRVAVSGDVSGVRALLVTQEPSGGTAKPTSAPVIMIPLD